jgi:hypothetical protein
MSVKAIMVNFPWVVGNYMVYSLAKLPSTCFRPLHLEEVTLPIVGQDIIHIIIIITIIIRLIITEGQLVPYPTDLEVIAVAMEATANQASRDEVGLISLWNS